MDSNMILEAVDIHKTVPMRDRTIRILCGISLAVSAGSSVSITGPSGSGKTTLLGILAGLDLPSSGIVRLLGQPFSKMGENARAMMRNGKVGFVFQSFHLLPNLTALENVSLALEVVPGSRKIRQQSQQALSVVGLEDRAEHLPSQLSGGEQQRVALARAMVINPAILFADEPTGNLDHGTSEMVAEMMFSLCRKSGSTLVLVSHDPGLADQCDSRFRIEAGKFVSGP